MELWRTTLTLLLFFTITLVSEGTNSTLDQQKLNITLQNKTEEMNSILDNPKLNFNLRNTPELNNSALDKPKLNFAFYKEPVLVATTEKTNITLNNTGNVYIKNSASNLAYFKNSNIDTEVPDMLNISRPSMEDSSPVEPHKTYKDNDAVDTQILLLDDFFFINGEKKKAESSQLKPTKLVAGKMAAVFAGGFLIACIAGYVGMLLWRRYLENRYGNRDLLVDEDYCAKMSDMEHFTI